METIVYIIRHIPTGCFVGSKIIRPTITTECLRSRQSALAAIRNLKDNGSILEQLKGLGIPYKKKDFELVMYYCQPADIFSVDEAITSGWVKKKEKETVQNITNKRSNIFDITF
jgi:hypothetical protein